MPVKSSAIAMNCETINSILKNSNCVYLSKIKEIHGNRETKVTPTKSAASRENVCEELIPIVPM
jgi:hypothetical protein